MMAPWRLVVGMIVLLIGVVLGGMAIYDSSYWASAGFFLAGVSLAISIIAWEPGGSSVSLWGTIIGMVFTAISIFGAFASSYALNQKVIKAQSDFIEIIRRLDTEPSGLNESERQLVSQAFKVCVMQRTQDYKDLTANAIKALNMGPGATLADGVDSAVDRVKSVRCLDYFQDLNRTQSLLFTEFVKDHPWVIHSYTK